MAPSNCYTVFRLILVLVLMPCAVGAEPAVLAVCKACHGADGSGVGKKYVPIISGIPAAHLEEALYAYIDGARQCTVEPAMCGAAAALSDEQVTEVAEHYSALPRYSHATTFDEKLVIKGEEFHNRLCARCHVPPDDPDVGDVLGYPLHGQRADYLEYALAAYLRGTRENLLPEMEEKIRQLREGDVKALVNYYISY